MDIDLFEFFGKMASGGIVLETAPERSCLEKSYIIIGNFYLLQNYCVQENLKTAGSGLSQTDFRAVVADAAEQTGVLMFETLDDDTLVFEGNREQGQAIQKLLGGRISVAVVSEQELRVTHDHYASLEAGEDAHLLSSLSVFVETRHLDA